MADEHKEWERSSEAERKELLHRLWLAEARAMLAVLENTAPGDIQAAQLAAVRAFLADQGVRSDNLDNPAGVIDPMEKELAAQVRALEVGDGDGDGDGALPEAGSADGDKDWPSRLEQNHDEGNL